MHPIGMGLHLPTASNVPNHNAKNPLDTILAVYWVCARVALSSLLDAHGPQK